MPWKLSSYIRPYCSCVELARIPTLRLRHSLQGMRREHPRPDRNHAEQLDCCQLSVVWDEEALPPSEIFPGTPSQKFLGGHHRGVVAINSAKFDELPGKSQIERRAWIGSEDAARMAGRAEAKTTISRMEMNPIA